MFWRDPDDLNIEPPPEETWEEYSQYDKKNLRFLTFSEFDQLETASIFHIEQNVPPYGAIDRDFVPLNFLSSLFLQTHKADVKMPSGNTDKPVIEDNRDGTVSIRYDPREEGTHELALKYNGEHVQGSPFKFHVDSIASGYVTAYGPGLTHGVTGEPALFTISTKGAGAGGLSMAVEGPSKAEINYKDNKDGTVSVNYLLTDMQ